MSSLSREEYIQRCQTRLQSCISIPDQELWMGNKTSDEFVKMMLDDKVYHKIITDAFDRCFSDNESVLIPFLYNSETKRYEEIEETFPKCERMSAWLSSVFRYVKGKLDKSHQIVWDLVEMYLDEELESFVTKLEVFLLDDNGTRVDVKKYRFLCVSSPQDDAGMFVCHDDFKEIFEDAKECFA